MARYAAPVVVTGEVVVMAPADAFEWPCADCAVETHPWEMYVVTDEVWEQAGAGDGFLCIGCLEDRLDRALEPVDFPRYPLNDGAECDSVRLRIRKGSGRCTGPLYPVAIAAVIEAGADVGEIAAALGLEEVFLRLQVESFQRMENTDDPEA